mgnify:FL=1
MNQMIGHGQVTHAHTFSVASSINQVIDARKQTAIPSLKIKADHGQHYVICNLSDGRSTIS